jgi:hypothetical protein
MLQALPHEIEGVPMAQQTRTSRTATSDSDGNGQVLAYARKAGLRLVDAYESTLNTVAEYQDRAADAARVDWIGSLGHAQADFTRGLTSAYTSAARKALS